MPTNQNIVIIITGNGKTNKEIKNRKLALEIRNKVFKAQARQEHAIKDEFDNHQETFFLTCYIKKDQEWLPIGSIRSFIQEINGKQYGRASKIAVLSQYRNNGAANVYGISTNLLFAAENLIIKQNAKTSKIDKLLIKSLDTALKFYQRYGYQGNELIHDQDEPNFPYILLEKATPKHLNNIEFKIENLSENLIDITEANSMLLNNDNHQQIWKNVSFNDPIVSNEETFFQESFQ